MAKTGVRVAITLACTECKRRNYQTNKSKRNTPDRVEFKKYCRWCGKHTRIGRRGRWRQPRSADAASSGVQRGRAARAHERGRRAARSRARRAPRSAGRA